MSSVTRRIQEIHQPTGGFLNKDLFSVTQLNDLNVLHATEDLPPNITGTVVDYLTRYKMGTPLSEAFAISLRGASYVREQKNATFLLSIIHGLDSLSITSACKLVGYDVCYRAGVSHYRPVSQINPSQETIENIQIMVKRSLSFWDTYGPIVKDGFSFDGGYTHLVSKGDGDFLTADTLWDYKVITSEITTRHTLQLLMYYIMGIHSSVPEFQSIKYLGVYNSRLNRVYRCPVSSISKEAIQTVSHDIIGYDWTDAEYDQYDSILHKKAKNIFEIGDYVFNADHGYGTITSVQSGNGETFVDVLFETKQSWFINTCFLNHALKTTTGSIII